MTDSGADRELARLHERVRAYAAEWADRQHHDPGIAMAELFGFLADELAAYQDRIGREADLSWRRYIRVRLQQGRVQIDADWNDDSEDADGTEPG